jgi:hypothetical protein
LLPGASFGIEISGWAVVCVYIALVAIIVLVYKRYGVGRSKMPF